jgi:formate dehydrogenase iron-sulfur subunit
VFAAAATVAVLTTKMVRLARSSLYELYGSWQLVSTVLANKLLVRLVLLLAGTLFAAFTLSLWARLAGLLLILCGELIGRYIFFVSVVPSNIASGYLGKEAA